MKFFRTCIVFLALTQTHPICLGQYIIAGFAGTGPYIDLIPDTLLEALVVHLSPYPPDSVKLDVDSDGVDDFRINSAGDGGLGGGSGGCSITPLASYASVVSHLDTSEGCCPSQYIAELADTLNAGDTISSALRFNSGYSRFWSDTYGWATGPIISSWNNIGEHFVGIRLLYPFDTLYGWIRVEAVNDTHFKFYVKDFACNRNTHIGIQEKEKPLFQIFPNPFTDRLYVKCNLPGTTEIVIYDVTGKALAKETFAGEFFLDTRHFAKGIYLYVVRQGDEPRITGKLIRH